MLRIGYGIDMVTIRKFTDEYLKLRIFMVLRTHSDTIRIFTDAVAATYEP